MGQGRYVVVGLAVLTAAVAHAQPQGSAEERITALRARSDLAVPDGTLTSIEHLLATAERIERRFEEPARSWRRRALRYLAEVEAGRDPYPRAHGEIVNRGYRSPISTRLQGYAIYVPPDYDPSRTYPLYVALHGGSSNGNLFLGVVLGNNMDWLTYDEHLYDDYVARWTPDWIVVAPTGFGQIMWRWMGEQDVLDVIDDVQAHYAVDPDRVVLGGLSNGGVGAYAIGARHAWRFSTVQAMAGAPSWQQYLGGRGRLRDVERTEIPRYSGLHLARNYGNTTFRYYHGTTDTGPMRPNYVRDFTRQLQRLGVEAHERWYEAGHDILYRVHRHGRVYGDLTAPRDRSPRHVVVVTGDYRASRQHWIDVTRIETFPELATVDATAGEDGTLTITTENTHAFSVDLRDAPLRERVAIAIDGAEVYAGARAALGQVAHFVRPRGETRWRGGFPDDAGAHKRPGLSGPITDAYYERMVHVYGTANPEHTDDLRDAAQRGARGWPLWSWDLEQEVLADTELDEATMRSAHVVLYGSPGDNAVLERIAGALPIRVDDGAVVVGDERYEGRDVGVRFVHPNPLAPNRYVIVQAGVNPDVVKRGNRLPEFVCDYIVYDNRTTPRAQQRVQARARARAQGYFDHRWRLPGADESEPQGAGPDQGQTASAPAGGDEEVEPQLPVPPAPPVPEPPGRYGVSSRDPAGRAARAIWARVPTFHNFRAETAGATWRVDRRAVWSIQAQEDCYAALREAGVEFRPAPSPSRIVPSPVEVLGPVEGVWWRMTHEERPLLTSCEMALRLPALMRVLKEHGVRGVEILSSYRNHPVTSFHTMGLALDLNRFWTDEGWLSVFSDYQETPMQETCRGPARGDRKARRLRGMACDLVRTRLLSSVLTPNYNEGHRDHFHIDARPNDPRIFLR